jgi:hypothetical protein
MLGAQEPQATLAAIGCIAMLAGDFWPVARDVIVKTDKLYCRALFVATVANNS